MEVMDERLYTNFKQYFPLFAEDAVSFTTSNIPCELIVKLTDGSFILYDDVDRTIRNLPDDPHELSKEECTKEFSYRLRKMMQIKGVTQQELSKRTGIAQSNISCYVRGTNSPSFYVIDKIAKALDCSIDQFRYY
jgi:DNA-binding Xre family transcriptional regulator